MAVNNIADMENASIGRLQTITKNTSHHDNCIKVMFREMEYIPWDNSDNIISAEAETIVRRVKNNMLVLLFLIGGPANVINMVVFYKHGLRDRVNLCLFALALADGLNLLLATMHHGEQLYIQFTTKETFGPVSSFLVNNNLVLLLSCDFVSPILSAIIATERCLCVFSPLRFQTLLRTRTMAVIIVAVYILVFGLHTIVAFRYRIGCFYDLLSGVVIQTLIEGEFYKAHREFIDELDSFVFGIGLHGLEVIVVTTTTIMTIIKLRQSGTWRSGTSSSISSREVALTKMLIGNSIFFIACMLPGALIRFSWLFLPEVNSGRRHHNLFLSSLWVNETFLFINSTFNIFIYYSMGSRFRETLWALFGKERKPEKR